MNKQIMVYGTSYHESNLSTERNNTIDICNNIEKSWMLYDKAREVQWKRFHLYEMLSKGRPII